MKKIITSIACLLLLSTITPEANAQKNYNTGLGIRLGYAYGLSVKHFLSESVSFEGIVSSRYYGRGRYYGRRYDRGYAGFNFTALFQKHWQIGNINGFNWFVGGGAHIGANGYDDRPYAVFGIDGNIGLEYTIPNVPVTFQLDYKPSIHIYQYYELGYDEVALSIRYVF